MSKKAAHHETTPLRTANPAHMPDTKPTIGVEPVPQPTPQGDGNASAGVTVPSTPAPKEESKALSDLPVLRGKRWYITLSALIAVASSLIGGTYFVVDYVELKPAKDKVADLQQAATSYETERQTLKSQLERLTLQYNEVLKSTERPLLAFPADGTSVLGTEQTFVWDYAKHDTVAGYIFQIRSISDPGKPLVEQNVVRSEDKKAFYSLANVPAAEYLWRIRPGEFANGQEIVQGPWSNAATFQVYATVQDRIRATGTLLVATTPTSYDPFVASDGNGDYSGFEVELVNFFAIELSKRMQLSHPLKVKPLEIPWAQMFGAMQRGEADIAIRSITYSATREREYPNLRFSEGYVKNHQIFVQTRHDGAFPSALEHAVVGVKANSINAQAASYLAPKFKFTVDASYTAYGDLYQALRSGTINFALVDSTLAAKFLNDQFFQLGPALDSELKSFYERELGRTGEDYAILVHDAGSKETLRQTLNEILTSPDGRSFLATLRAKYHVPE